MLFQKKKETAKPEFSVQRYTKHTLENMQGYFITFPVLPVDDQIPKYRWPTWRFENDIYKAVFEGQCLFAHLLDICEDVTKRSFWGKPLETRHSCLFGGCAEPLLKYIQEKSPHWQWKLLEHQTHSKDEIQHELSLYILTPDADPKVIELYDSEDEEFQLCGLSPQQAVNDFDIWVQNAEEKGEYPPCAVVFGNAHIVYINPELYPEEQLFERLRTVGEKYNTPLTIEQANTQ